LDSSLLVNVVKTADLLCVHKLLLQVILEMLI